MGLPAPPNVFMGIGGSKGHAQSLPLPDGRGSVWGWGGGAGRRSEGLGTGSSVAPFMRGLRGADVCAGGSTALQGEAGGEIEQ